MLSGGGNGSIAEAFQKICLLWLGTEGHLQTLEQSFSQSLQVSQGHRP